jgi:co-chaperonin GroES (HSP10)
MKVKGKVIPIRDHVLVSDMDFGMQKTQSGILITSDNGKSSGVKPRWGKVWAVGPEQKDIKVGEWICIEHGRWTRTIELEQEDGNILELRRVETSAILMSADEKPDDVDVRAGIGAGSNVNFNIPGA